MQSPLGGSSVFKNFHLRRKTEGLLLKRPYSRVQDPNPNPKSTEVNGSLSIDFCVHWTALTPFPSALPKAQISESTDSAEIQKFLAGSMNEVCVGKAQYFNVLNYQFHFLYSDSTVAEFKAFSNPPQSTNQVLPLLNIQKKILHKIYHRLWKAAV